MAASWANIGTTTMVVYTIFAATLSVTVTGSDVINDLEMIPGDKRDLRDNTIDFNAQLMRQLRDAPQEAQDENSVLTRYPLLSGFLLGAGPWKDFDSSKSSPSVRKRVNDKMLVQSLAALLEDMKNKDANSKLRMPSLRFG